MTSYAIEGMTCNGCLTTVTAALKRLSPGVSVTLDPPRAVFPETDAPSERAVGEALEGTRYSARSERMETGVADDGAAPTPEAQPAEGWVATYYPLLLIVGYIALGAFAGPIAHGGFSIAGYLNAFMAGFFLVFSFFKLLDLRGFADSYATYDLLAARWHGYGYVYPFIEMGLGFAFLFGFQPEIANAAALIVMGFSSLGVIAALRDKRQIRCACLGTVLNLPMSTVTLVEDLAMVVMSIFMLLHLAR